MHCNTCKCAQHDHCCRRAVKLHSFIHSLQPLQSFFCVLYLNIRSLKEHFHFHFQDIIQDIGPKYNGLLCFSEAKVYNYSKYRFHKMKCFVNKTGTDKHGNVVYSNLSESRETLFQTDIIEIVAVKAGNSIVISVNIPPGHPFQHILKEIQSLIQQAKSTASKNDLEGILVIADFNLSIERVNKVSSLLNGFGFSQFVSKLTHQLESILDLVFSSVKDIKIRNVPVWFSDHLAVILHVKN